jgi:(S)-ureidoglycine aminohydrolase
MLPDLGGSRSSHAADHLLHTPDAFVRAPLPGMRGATAVVHVGPARGARFTQYTVEFERGGMLGPAAGERFLYVLDGRVTVDGDVLERGGYAFLPTGDRAGIHAGTAAKAAVIEKIHQPGAGDSPARVLGHEREVAGQALGGDSALVVRSLMPADDRYDFAVNTMTYLPGASLPMVEVHVMEHGLLMLEGGGIYRLGDRWYPVTAGDFIWMGSFCPQWFGALGKRPAKYLIYKDWNRHPL